MTSDPREGRMRLTILGGFLGAGKSTWLRHHLHHGELRDAMVVVNEAADAPVDGALLARLDAPACSCGRLRLLREAFGSRGAAP